MHIKRSHTIVGSSDRGTYHDDLPDNTAFSVSKIIQIDVLHGTAVYGFKVFWESHHSPWRGLYLPQLDRSKFKLEKDEFITRVDGTTLGCWHATHMFASLRFYTNYGRVQSFGSPAVESFSFTGGGGIDTQSGSRMGLLSFETWMFTENTIFALRPTFAEYPLPEARVTITSSDRRNVKYEYTGDGEPGSSFLRHLTCPTIALHVGATPTAVTLHVKEDTLCQLPFFTAALRGGFKETAEKAIAMPEDSPDVVSALIEFLSTGSYTYSYDSETVSEEDEGGFHVDIFAVAGKYGCEALEVDARTSFVDVLSAVEEGGSGVTLLRLWRRAYEGGLRATANWGTGLDVDGFKIRMVRCVRMVMAQCMAEFDAAVKEVDGLGFDLMDIAIGLSGAESVPA